jgi:hypothetical protein
MKYLKIKMNAQKKSSESLAKEDESIVLPVRPFKKSLTEIPVSKDFYK